MTHNTESLTTAISGIARREDGFTVPAHVARTELNGFFIVHLYSDPNSTWCDEGTIYVFDNDIFVTEAVARFNYSTSLYALNHGSYCTRKDAIAQAVAFLTK